MISNVFALARLALLMKQIQLASLDFKSPRCPHTCAKCVRPLVMTNISLKLTERQTLHTQWFPHCSCFGDEFCVPFAPPWAVHCGPCRLAKRYVCAAKSFAAVSDICVPHLVRTPQNVFQRENMGKRKLKLFEQLCLWSTQAVVCRSGSAHCRQTRSQ